VQFRQRGQLVVEFANLTAPFDLRLPVIAKRVKYFCPSIDFGIGAAETTEHLSYISLVIRDLSQLVLAEDLYSAQQVQR
jgi:hypothetical protein